NTALLRPKREQPGRWVLFGIYSGANRLESALHRPSEPARQIRSVSTLSTSLEVPPRPPNWNACVANACGLVEQFFNPNEKTFQESKIGNTGLHERTVAPGPVPGQGKDRPVPDLPRSIPELLALLPAALGQKEND